MSSAHSREAGVPIGQLARTHPGKNLPLQIGHSAAGYYLGTFDVEGPCSRESEYFGSHEAARHALSTGRWRQRPWP